MPILSRHLLFMTAGQLNLSLSIYIYIYKYIFYEHVYFIDYWIFFDLYLYFIVRRRIVERFIIPLCHNLYHYRKLPLVLISYWTEVFNFLFVRLCCSFRELTWVGNKEKNRTDTKYIFFLCKFCRCVRFCIHEVNRTACFLRYDDLWWKREYCDAPKHWFWGLQYCNTKKSSCWHPVYLSSYIDFS